ncbi:hypothetical protein [Flaviaesturariibacter aridisoli]|uniref:FHA domain-containing protein n=1 Tax=Flaviaesturariibacter aridisoli TaxID=2545761 RepID=A0A4R4E372_9BACT|nr:hypothetical protein [Flaviaesturariibacter aridisoli]TCZ73367.1 hypothetical protein E0486_06760 [Flaviaesturariibacter aridisoli]
MSEKPNFWQRLGLHDWFVNKPESAPTGDRAALTPDTIYAYILQQFEASVRALSFASRVVFYHEYIVVFHPADYADFQEHRKGLLGMIAQECVAEFTRRLQEAARSGRTVVPAANKWVFRFVSHPGYAPGDLGFIGKLLPEGSGRAPEGNLRVTYIPRQTGQAETSEMSIDTLSAFTYYSEGYYELPFRLEPSPGGSAAAATTAGGGLARLEAVVPDKAYAGKKIEFRMTGDELTVSGPADNREGVDVFRVPSEWVDTPHLRIRYARGEDRFYLSAFGEKTMLNEKEVARSGPQQPDWTELPLNSRIVLNGIVGLNFYKS